MRSQPESHSQKRELSRSSSEEKIELKFLEPILGKHVSLWFQYLEDEKFSS